MTSQYYCITNLKPGLGAYWDHQTTWTMCCSINYHVRTLSLGQEPKAWRRDMRLGMRHS